MGPAQILPLLMALEQLPVIGLPLAETLDPTLQVLVEAGYNRAISPGQPTPWNLLYFPNPISFGEDLLVSIPTGPDNGIAHSQLTSVSDGGTPLASPLGRAAGLPALTPVAAPTPSATTTTADTKSGQPTGSTNSDATIASPPAPKDDRDHRHRPLLGRWAGEQGARRAAGRPDAIHRGERELDDAAGQSGQVVARDAVNAAP